MVAPTKTYLNLNRLDSPMGQILVVTEGQNLCALEFADHEPRMQKFLQARYGAFSLVQAQDTLGICDRIQSYFAGDFNSLTPITVSPGGTPFQQRVWSTLREIPAGTTLTYGTLATQLGNPNASRAVGLANSRNPIAIVVPCHRVVGANAQLTGYAGGIERKRWLLQHENALTQEDCQQISLPLKI
ncbi:Methylated-DNA--protein-cysteine methyltransferase [Acaryochloris thomasi RCC1774]|uniref:Methylated-DNA--protein-cysteine methyltransferase n=1 Tax=Acaryochloris thomasi RCC1774 TaxID=1764569 RepID=A0A2W1JIQ1_9CYAN|nr:methylated-DNA--[protein]-cysteine S-methyltransferase [Acaryochloris thomasi]PZD73318.1 Methylated-DNA--protein-cysteine methyltransferase [Acaryochloris thomasi RCC1774]